MTQWTCTTPIVAATESAFLRVMVAAQKARRQSQVEAVRSASMHTWAGRGSQAGSAPCSAASYAADNSSCRSVTDVPSVMEWCTLASRTCCSRLIVHTYVMRAHT